MPSTRQHPAKTIEVVGRSGVGKATLMGHLMYKCGAIDMLVMEKLQRAGISKYNEMVKYFIDNSMELSFESRRFNYTFTDVSSQVDPADCTIYMIDVEAAKANETVHLPAIEGDTNTGRAQKVVVVVNKMDTINWSEEVYAETAQAAASRMSGYGSRSHDTPIIPIAALHGDNLLEPSAKSSWFCSHTQGPTTLIDALDLDPTMTV